jgi:Sec-independent protein translocase protein TatA
MFGLSVGEILLLIVVMVVFIKPEDLPAIVRQLGRMYGQLMQIYRTFMDEINSFGDLKK